MARDLSPNDLYGGPPVIDAPEHCRPIKRPTTRRYGLRSRVLRTRSGMIPQKSMTQYPRHDFYLPSKAANGPSPYTALPPTIVSTACNSPTFSVGTVM